jgi:hypothetical protein
MIKPTFADAQSWETANLLMQPVLIRTIDNIRKQLENSTWQGEYREFPIWPDDVAAETQAKVALLQQELRSAPPEAVDEIEDALATMPQPMPGYELILSQTGRESVVINVWELCYRICFSNAVAMANGAAAEVDLSLLEPDTQAVDWNRLDEKTQRLVAEVFEQCNY